MVYDVIRRSRYSAAAVTRVSRVRFKRMVGPDERLCIVAVPRKEQAGSYSFRITVGKEMVCSGLMTLEPFPTDRLRTQRRAAPPDGDGGATFDKGE